MDLNSKIPKEGINETGIQDHDLPFRVRERLTIIFSGAAFSKFDGILLGVGRVS